ncbi:heme-degrading domain-containing protein [Clostridium grantii]|uniref:Uncharacterized protein, UPF0303 family n=1 Tax=Clostridium grantii DSM 8605 TaxID=1121316 RepID=A0A1M5WAF7_9CLOT|nr:heme-binding protein [Clostridium grantii]SHH84440.1 Uncharacterized protein, UPF0303 family [Clostridium grantii DSM 8605]
MKWEKILRIVEEQENVLHFKHFTNEDAWEVGNIIVEEARKNKFPAAISIRLNNGFTVFQYGFNGTGLDHENWMKRKENTVKVKAMSSMRAEAILKTQGITLADWFLESKDFSTCGGGFPIHVDGVGIIGTIIVSGISVIMDHELIIEGLCKYLKVESLERIKED